MDKRTFMTARGRLSRSFGLVICLVLLFSLAGVLPPQTVQAAPITVSNTNDSGAGSLRKAIADASSGDTINISVTGTITLTTGELLVAQNVTIFGPGEASLTISGNSSSGVFHIASGKTVIISDITVADGSANNGGGIYNEGTLTLCNCTVSGNTVPLYGGGICNTGTLTMSLCTISGNTYSISGGGIYNEYKEKMNNSNVSGKTA